MKLQSLIKKASAEAMNNNSPMRFSIGIVDSISPLKISIDQKLLLTEEFLIVSKSLTDYEITMTMSHQTEFASGGSGDSSFASHAHSISGTKTFMVHNALKVGDKVILLQDNGGQSYLVFDKVVD